MDMDRDRETGTGGIVGQEDREIGTGGKGQGGRRIVEQGDRDGDRKENKDLFQTPDKPNRIYSLSCWCMNK